VARILIVGGGSPGRRLAELMVAHGHAVRVTTRSERQRAAIEASGAECWIGTPDRLATMRGALEGVTIACWLLARARGENGASGESEQAADQQIAALHGSRLEFFLGQAIDTTVRGLIYDASPGTVAPELLARGAEIFASLTRLNAIPAIVLDAGEDAWLAAVADAVDALLAGRVQPPVERR
jgi:hypothetical protein